MLKAITILAVFLGVFTASFTMTDAKPKGPTILQRKILKEFRKNPQQCPMYSEDLILSSSDGELIELLLNTCPIEGIPAEKLKQLLPKEPQKQEEQYRLGLRQRDAAGRSQETPVSIRPRDNSPSPRHSTPASLLC